MTSTDHLSPSSTQLAIAGTLLARLANAEFDRLGDAFEPDFRALAMLPGGIFEWPEPATVRAAFEQWFGDVAEYDVTDFTVSLIRRRMHLRWRITVAGGHLGDGRYVVEQQIYADTGRTGRIGSMSLLCSGFVREGTDA
jgi:hypothetical protein